LPTRLDITDHLDKSRTVDRMATVGTEVELLDELFTPEQLERGGE